jgi:hypothetical protein
MVNEMRKMINQVKNFGKKILNEEDKKNIKTVKYNIPNVAILRRMQTTPTFKNLTRIELKVGDNIENVNHYTFSQMEKLFPLLDVSVEDITGK